MGRQSAAPPAETDELLGLVCSQCGRNRWRVTHTREGFALIRRFRTCLTPGCGHKVRTRETVEADAHPDHDAG